MAVSVKLQARQTQNLAMTPQLVQSIKLLQMNSIELLQHIEQEMEKNPLLELADESATDYVRSGEQGREAAPEASSEKKQDSAGVSDELDTSRQALEEKLDSNFENEFDGDRSGGEEGSEAFHTTGGGLGSSSGPSMASAEAYNLEEFTAGTVTLRDHLNEQLAVMKLSAVERLVAGELIDSLDEDGYMRRETGEIALQLGVPEETVLTALAHVQQLEPTGIGARDLSECLSMQLKERDRFDPAMACLISNLDLLARRDFNQLRKLCQVDLEDIMQMMEEIRLLDPRPARAFDHTPVQTVIPDVFVSERPDGGFAVELNPDALPRVLVNQTYQAVLSRKNGDKREKAFITDCLQNANWLVRSLEQRAQTILKVMTEVVRQQDGFFAFGIRHLKPMSLKQVADAIGVHESTVSRVTSNKYVLTNRGLFELKFFFTAAIQATGGDESHSAESVRHEIRRLIEGEKADKVLSDDTIVDILNKQGVDIARRTVAKYREAMNIPSSVQRRREKRAALAIS